MGNRARVELSADGMMVHLMHSNRLVEELDAGQAWDLGDDLQWAARTIWDAVLPEVDVAQDAEGEDGDADADPAVPETEPQAEALGDAHGSGDQIQEDLDE